MLFYRLQKVRQTNHAFVVKREGEKRNKNKNMGTERGSTVKQMGKGWDLWGGSGGGGGGGGG